MQSAFADSSSDSYNDRIRSDANPEGNLCCALYELHTEAVYCAACYAGKLGSLIESVNKVCSYFYGPILGVFLLAFMVRRCNGTGAFYGLIAGEIAVFAVAYYSSISWLYYNVVGVAVVPAAGTAISMLRPSQ